MKISKELLRNLIKECMQDMSVGVSNFAPPVASGMAPPMMPAKPDGFGGQPYKVDQHGYEGRMSKANLFKIAEYAMELHNMIHDNEDLEPWVQEKIAVASSMLDSIGHYMQYEKMRGPQVGE